MGAGYGGGKGSSREKSVKEMEDQSKKNKEVKPGWFKSLFNQKGRESKYNIGTLPQKKKDGGIIKNPCDFGKITKLMKKKK